MKKSSNPFLVILEFFEIAIGTIIAILLLLVSSRIAVDIWQDWGGRS